MSGSVSPLAVAMEEFYGLVGAIKRSEEPPFANLSLAFRNMLFNQNSLTHKIIINRDQFGNRHTSPVDNNLFTSPDSQKQASQFGLNLIDVYLNHDLRC